MSNNWATPAWTEEDEKEYALLERQPASKMSASNLAKFSEMCYRRTLAAKAEFGKWLRESSAVAECLALKEEDFSKALNHVQALAQFSSEDRLGPHPSQERLRTTMAVKHDKLIGLTSVLIRYEAISTRLGNLLNVAQEYWQGLTSKQSEWQVRGELISFKQIQRLRKLKGLATEVVYTAKRLQEVLVQGQSMESRLVEIRRQELELGE